MLRREFLRSGGAILIVGDLNGDPDFRIGRNPDLKYSTYNLLLQFSWGVDDLPVEQADLLLTYFGWLNSGKILRVEIELPEELPFATFPRVNLQLRIHTDNELKIRLLTDVTVELYRNTWLTRKRAT